MYICVTWMHIAYQDVPKLVGEIAPEGIESQTGANFQSPCDSLTNVNENLLPRSRRLMGESRSFGI